MFPLPPIRVHHRVCQGRLLAGAPLISSDKWTELAKKFISSFIKVMGAEQEWPRAGGAGRAGAAGCHFTN